MAGSRTPVGRGASELHGPTDAVDNEVGNND